MKLYLMRHSETEWNRQKRIQGHTDIELNENGRKIAGLAAVGMAHIPFDYCFSSPLVRARETADIILSNNRHFQTTGRRYQVDHRVKEIGFGEWEGLHSAREYGEVDRDLFEEYYFRLDGAYCPNGGERLKNVVDRSLDFLDEIAANADYDGKTILVLTHGCTMRCILSRFSEDPEYFLHPHVPFNCEAAIIEKNAEGKLILTDPGSIYYDSALAINYYGY